MTPLREIAPEAIAAAWNADVPPRYHIDAGLVEQNLLGSVLLHHEASFWSDGAFVAVKRNAASLYTGPDPNSAHLSLFNAGSCDVLREAVAVLRAQGRKTMVVGEDSGHFLPGAPTDVSWMGGFLREEGFVRGGLSFDLERDLRDSVATPVASGEYRRLEQSDIEALDEFLVREFPGRWRFDVTRQIEHEGSGAVFGLFLEGRCEGFALLQSEDGSHPIGGAMWRSGLGVRWGALGPIGVSAHLRGKGHGHALLGAALANLKSRGVAQTIIDWTGLVDFYGTQGFSVTRSYRSYRLDLAADRSREA